MKRPELQDSGKTKRSDRSWERLPTLGTADLGERASNSRAYPACSTGENDGKPLIRNRDRTFVASGRGKLRSRTWWCTPRRKTQPSRKWPRLPYPSSLLVASSRVAYHRFRFIAKCVGEAVGSRQVHILERRLRLAAAAAARHRTAQRVSRSYTCDVDTRHGRGQASSA